MKQFILITVCVATLGALAGCNTNDTDENQNQAKQLLDRINSASVTFIYKDPEVQNFLREPQEIWLTGHFLFEEDLAPDIIFGFKIGWLEGLERPINFSGANWTAQMGLNRSGLLSYPIGSNENLNGTPTPVEIKNWQTKNLNLFLEPNTWYQVNITMNIGTRQFVRFQIIGPDINIKEDLINQQLNYPIYQPFDQSSLTISAFALRSKEFAPENIGTTKVYFDDFETIIQVNEQFNKQIFTTDFEQQQIIGPLPISLPIYALQSIQEQSWFLENADAKIAITSKYSRSGTQALECNASLRLVQ